MENELTHQPITPADQFGRLEQVDLTNCDREPIHIPGSIQPHGLLLVLSEPDFTILQVSANSTEILDCPIDRLLNQPLEHLVDAEQISEIRCCLSEEFQHVNPLKVRLCSHKTQMFDAIVHRSEAVTILELEPISAEESVNFFDFYRSIKAPITRIQNTTSLSQLCNVVAQEVRKITGFDRVMIYRFDPDGAGVVIAEDRQSELEPFLELRYPASDIPKQARHLYTLNLLRLIPNVNYESVKLVPELNPLTNAPLDLSLSILRSVSPLHIEYLQNMGVTASMSISLIKDQQLWGLVACHHNTPRHVPYELRTICEFLGQVMSIELTAKEATEGLDYKLSLRSLQSRLSAALSATDDLVMGLITDPNNLMDLTGAQGTAICLGDDITLRGATPTAAEINQLIDWFELQNRQEILFHTDALPSLYPAAMAFKSTASGVIILCLSRIQKAYVLWFRPEVIQTVNWGGDPHKPVVVEDGSLRMSPRKSFSLWQETVQLQSLPWEACELEAALELRSAIISIVLRRSDELAKINVELERSNSELDAFAYVASHDLKEPLRGIHNYSSFLLEDYADVLNEDGVSKLQTLVRLTQRLEDLINSLLHFSRIGRIEPSMQPVDLDALVRQVLEIVGMSFPDSTVAIEIPRSLPTIRCDRVQMSEVFTNLISNAIKYNDKTEKQIEIGYLDAADAADILPQDRRQLEGKTIFYVKDNGIGIRERHLETVFRIFKRLHPAGRYGGGTGAGLTIAQKIIERHGGQIWLESVYGEGSIFYFAL